MTPPPPTTRLRLNRYLAGRGVASRRGADELIEAGRVAVNGRTAVLGTVVDPGTDVVAVDGGPVPPELGRRTLMLNKPLGVLSTRHDPGGRPTVLDLVEDPAGLFPVGRLDADSRGLLLLTTDGELAFRLTHPRHGIRKLYLVAVRGRVGAAALRTLVGGVQLEDGPARALSATPAGERHGDSLVEVEMGEGRRREVRRLCAAAGLVVTDLERIGFGPLRLGRLAEGTVRRLRPAEATMLYDAVGLSGGTSDDVPRARRASAGSPAQTGSRGHREAMIAAGRGESPQQNPGVAEGIATPRPPHGGGRAAPERNA